MKRILIILAFVPMLSYSQKYLDRSWSDCYTSLSDYELIGKADTIKGRSRIDQSIIILVFEKKICIQEVECYGYKSVGHKLSELRDKWVLKGQVKSNAFMYQNGAYFLMIEFWEDNFTINILKP